MVRMMFYYCFLNSQESSIPNKDQVESVGTEARLSIDYGNWDGKETR